MSGLFSKSSLVAAPVAAISYIAVTAVSASPAGAVSQPFVPKATIPPTAAVPVSVVAKPVGPPTVTVKPGDTLSALGTRLRRSWPALAGFNHLRNPNLIYPGQVLRIPDASWSPPPGSVNLPMVTRPVVHIASRYATPTYHSARSYSAASGCYGITDANALYVIGRESGCRTSAYNPSGACGIGQLMSGCYGGSASAQISAMTSYVQSRYGSWSAAASHERAFGWY